MAMINRLLLIGMLALASGAWMCEGPTKPSPTPPKDPGVALSRG